ncbi:ABC transporter ATP-binding protein [Microbacterium sp.]|uniref:ABC transporter ATP-binding protein n=1 Tax=Microbacterium sp. TaxID=51671 RepID=UPI00333FA284
MKEQIAILRRILDHLPPNARRYILSYMVWSSSLAILDVAALMLLAASLSSMINQLPVPLPVIGPVGPSGYVWIILGVSALIIVKSMLAVWMQWRATRRMAAFELEIGDRLFDSYIRAPWTERLKRNASELVRMADIGIANLTSGFLLPFMNLPSLLATSVVIMVLILFVQPLTAVVTIVYLGLIAVFLYVGLSARTVQAGRVNRDYSFRVASLITDMVGALKEITLRNKAADVAEVVRDNRRFTAKARANLNFLGAVPRFVLDAALVGGFVLVGGAALLFGDGDMSAAISAVALFGVAGMRLVPSLTSLQAINSQLMANGVHAHLVIDDIELAEEFLRNEEHIGKHAIEGDPRELTLSGVGFSYPNSEEPALRDVNATVRLGSTLGIVGSSGAGKSTLIDVLLGLITPTEGEISLGSQSLVDVLSAWRGRVGYVPQDVALFDGTVAQNVALSWGDDIDEERVREALDRAQLLTVVDGRLGGVSARIGDRGLGLSGGQRQRLGLARALYAEPLVLVLDEATSALDTRTESEVMKAIRELRGDVTIISVAHRLATIRDNDEIWFMRDGRIEARGAFDEVVAAEPEFERQARLAGLA